MLKNPPAEEQISQPMQHCIMGKLSTHIDRKAFPAVFIKDREHPQRPTISSTVMHKIIAPDVILMLRTKSNTRPIVMPHPSPFRLTLGNLQPLLPPQPFNTLVIHLEMVS
jgi:hypothetical protein